MDTPAARQPATIIAERRRDGDVLAGFLVVVLAFAAYRGWSGAPIVAGLCAVAAVGVALAWAWWRRNPAWYLSISADEIAFRRVGKEGVTIRRVDAARIAVRRESNERGWFVTAVDAPHVPEISLIGFKPDEGRRACLEHGWSVV